MVLLEALVNLEACWVSTGNLKSEVHALDWYTPMDTRKVAHLQSCLNRLGLGEQLMEDGVYGSKTSEELGHFLERWDQFMRKHGGRLEKLKSLASSAQLTIKAGARWAVEGRPRHEMTIAPYGSYKRLLGTKRYMPDFSNRQRKKAHGARKKTPISAVNPNYQVISQIEVDGLKWANKVADTLKN